MKNKAYENLVEKYDYAKECVEEYFAELDADKLEQGKKLFELYKDYNCYNINKPYSLCELQVEKNTYKRTEGENKILKEVFEKLDLDIRPFIVDYWLESIQKLTKDFKVENIKYIYEDSDSEMELILQDKNIFYKQYRYFVRVGKSIWGDTDKYSLVEIR